MKRLSVILLAAALCAAPSCKHAAKPADGAPAVAIKDTKDGKKKAGEADKDAEKPKEEEKKSGGLFSGWFGTKKDDAAPAAEKKDKPAEPAAAPEEKKGGGLLSGWFGKKKDADVPEKKDEKKEEKPVAAAAPAKKGGGLFGWLFGKKDAEPEAAPGTRTEEEQRFTDTCASMGAAGGNVVGKDGFIFSGAELKRVGALPGPGGCRTAVGAIAEYQQTLRKEGVQLVVVPVPVRSMIYADKISKDLKVKSRRVDSGIADAMSALRERGVRVVDLTDTLYSGRLEKEAPSYTRTANALSPAGVRAAAAEVASEVRSSAGSRGLGKGAAMGAEEMSITFQGPLAASANPVAPAETLKVRNVGRTKDGGGLKAVSFGSSGAPVMIMGDGNILAWREANNPAGASGTFASLADQLSYELAADIDVLSNNQDGRNAPRMRILSSGTAGKNMLHSTRVVVWVFSALDLASSNWKRTPLRLQFTEVQPMLDLQ